MSVAKRFADDGFTSKVGNILEDRIARLKPYTLGTDESISRRDVAEFCHKLIKDLRKQMNPEKGGKNLQAWNDAKGMLKDLIDWEKFSVLKFDDSAIKYLEEKEIVEVLDRYKTFVLTGEVKTKYPPPKLLGETEQILCVDKPTNYICAYGDRDRGAPELQKLGSPTALLNGPTNAIQIHEYLALKFDFDTARKTREWWKKEETALTCSCGKCGYCAVTQTGCCNRLDKETSGVMIAAKTVEGFPEIRNQFASEHSVEKGGTEKYYLALVHGHIELPDKKEYRCEHWQHEPEEPDPKFPRRRRARIEVSQVWDKDKPTAAGYGAACCFDSGAGEGPKWREAGQKPQWSVTFYEPVGWFEDKNEKKYTLAHIQIITGRRHQIRFHMAEVGHVLVGDSKYGAPGEDRHWCPRVFLHSYQTKFREPFTLRWFEAMSPLPQDLGEIMEKNLTVLRFKDPPPEEEIVKGKEDDHKLKSRRHHKKFEKFLTQYNPAEPLLVGHDVTSAAEDAVKANPNFTIRAADHARAAVHGTNGAAEQAQDADDAFDALVAAAEKEYNSAPEAAHSWKSNSWDNSPEKWPQPDPKRRRLVVPPQNAKWTPQTPPDEIQRPASQPPPEQQSYSPTHAVAAAQPQPPAMPPQQAMAPQAMAPQAMAPAVTTGWKRRESRSSPGVYYYWHEATGQTSAEPPAPWMLRESRSQPGVCYYWNTVTGQTSPDKPEI